VAAPDIFLAGVIQGSVCGHRIADQGYRAEIRSAINAQAPSVTVYDPLANHPGALEYPIEQARETFYGHLNLVRRSRLLVAYLPEASLGTAIEMWEARGAGIPVVAISPMAENWVIRLLATVLCEDIAAFRRWVASGALERMLGPRAEAGRLPAERGLP
jgi:hypothetical protein